MKRGCSDVSTLLFVSKFVTYPTKVIATKEFGLSNFKYMTAKSQIMGSKKQITQNLHDSFTGNLHRYSKILFHVK